MPKKNPKILLFNLTTGSGVETTGNVVASMFDEYTNKHPNNFLMYKENQPPYRTLEHIVEFKPDVIILNELHQRGMLSAHSYKTAFPKTKIILLNHCHPYLTEYPVVNKSPLFEWTNDDGVESINNFLGNKIEHIINLNYIPPNKTISSEIKGKVYKRYFPLKNEFKKIKPLYERKRNFLFYGTVHPQKLSLDFIELFKSQPDISLDIYGRWMHNPTTMERMYDFSYEEYKQSILDIPNINYRGWMPQEEMIDIINDYKCFVMPHDGSEPFCIALAEAIRCGCLAMVTNDRRETWATWIDWAKGQYLEYQTAEKLIEKMHYFAANKNNMDFMRELDNTTTLNSIEMTEKTSYQSFKKLLHSFIF